MESNRDESIKCIQLAKQYYSERQYEMAVKYSQKAHRLFPSAETSELTNLTSTALNSSQTSANASNGGDNEYTDEQVKAVRHINTCKSHYEILGVTSDAGDDDIKRQYRKLALQFHPDKNKAPAADQAFKAVRYAFDVLSDADKRKQYDMSGSDERQRSSSETHYENEEWHYRSPVVWRYSYAGLVSDRPVLGGHDVNGEPIFVGRAVHEGDTIPGKIVPSHGVCYVPYGGGEHAHREYEVLTNPRAARLIWVSAADGQIPYGALQGGQQSDGLPLFIGRARHEGSLVVGKVHAGHRVLYLPFAGNEISKRYYEVLVNRDVEI